MRDFGYEAIQLLQKIKEKSLIPPENEVSTDITELLEAREHYLLHKDETGESCPDCGAPLLYGHGGGVKCSKCPYWFCF